MSIINNLESEFNMFISNMFNVISKKFKHVKRLIIDKIFKIIAKIKNYLYSLTTQTIKNTEPSFNNINNKVPLPNAYSGRFDNNYTKKIVDTLLE